jgi:hypothetical protein
MKVDMSAKAVTARLKRVSQLRRLCLSLAKAKSVPPKEKVKNGKERNIEGS